MSGKPGRLRPLSLSILSRPLWPTLPAVAEQRISAVLFCRGCTTLPRKSGTSRASAGSLEPHPSPSPGIRTGRSRGVSLVGCVRFLRRGYRRGMPRYHGTGPAQHHKPLRSVDPLDFPTVFSAKLLKYENEHVCHTPRRLGSTTATKTPHTPTV